MPTTLYSTATGTTPVIADLSDELRYDLDLYAGVDADFPAGDDSDYYFEYCFVCSRATDHRGEHDDLVEAGHATYSLTDGVVYFSR